MVSPPRNLAYVLAHPEAWRLLALLERGTIDRYEQVRKCLGMHPQAFLRLVDALTGFDLIRIRGDRSAHRPHGGPAPVHVELSPKGGAMLQILRSMDRALAEHREKLGVKDTGLLSVSA